jgi:anthranilate/para-aminobenzoate synthase component I
MRNDLGRICEFGSVKVERLCELEVHPTLFHLVSTVTGSLRKKLPHSAIIKALFPSGSITGAPKLSTMRIIASIEKSPRGLSMGSVGINIPSGFPGLTPVFEMNVAIRTMVIRGNEAVFNVGGGVVIDSDPSNEYDEALLKARALLAAAGAPEALDTSS